MPKSTPGSARGEGESQRSRARLPKYNTVAGDLRIFFGVNFRAARIRAGLTQTQVAEVLQTTPQYISKIERGQQNVTLGTMEALAQLVHDDVVRLLRKPPQAAQQK